MLDEFPLDNTVIHLNHAAVAPWPRRTVEAVTRFADENMRQGSAHYPRWLAVEQRLRRRLQRLIHAESPEEIALLKSTSEALSVVAYGLDWGSADNIVIPLQEFPSNRVVWQSLEPRFGVRTRLVDLDVPEPEQALMAATDRNTRLLSVSAVQYARGLRLDLEQLGQFCHSRGILFCVDAIQQLGALPFDVQACRADFVAADGHKWMLGPEGVALFYCRAERSDRLRLNQYGWHMLQAPGEYDRLEWTPAADARRFECGSPNMLGIHALDASLGLLLETGIDEISKMISSNISYLIDLLELSDFQILSPQALERRAGIVTFTREGLDATELHRRLTRAGVLCAPRGGGIRFSPHFYTARETLDQAVATLLDCLR